MAADNNNERERYYGSISNLENNNALPQATIDYFKTVLQGTSFGGTKRSNSGENHTGNDNDDSSSDEDVSVRSRRSRRNKRQRIDDSSLSGGGDEEEEKESDGEQQSTSDREGLSADEAPQEQGEVIDLCDESDVGSDASEDTTDAAANQNGPNTGRDDEEDLDMEDPIEIEPEIERIRRRKLTIAIQGFRSKKKDNEDNTAAASPKNSVRRRNNEPDRFDPESVVCKGATFRKGYTYRYRESARNPAESIDAIVGIQNFLPNHFANCVLIVPYSETILGQSGDGYSCTYRPSTFVQVEEELPPLSLVNFVKQDQGHQPLRLPEWVYQPQTPGCWHSFGYYKDPRHVDLRGVRAGPFRVIEGFAGAGGMSLGIEQAGFECAAAIEKDPWAVMTLTSNFSCPVFPGDFRDFLKHYDDKTYGKIHYLHCSTPCQGFSSANRLGGQHDEENNELALTFVEGVQKIRPLVATFENVMGMWRRQHIRYLKRMVQDLVETGYQVRCSKLMAADYGDPQLRPRIVLMATHPSLPPPAMPKKTHSGDDKGEGSPYVTAEQALVLLNEKPSEREQRSTTVHPGQNGLVRLKANGVAPSIRALGLPPFHFAEDRCISVRECAALQSFPRDFVFRGPSMKKKYAQVGNAVPVRLAVAVASAVKRILENEYANEPE